MTLRNPNRPLTGRGGQNPALMAVQDRAMEEASNLLRDPTSSNQERAVKILIAGGLTLVAATAFVVRHLAK